MFVLIHSYNELLTSDNDVMAFPTHERAYAEMLDQLRDAATDEDITLADRLEEGDLYDAEDDRWVGYLDRDETYLEDSDEKWVIFEVPGAFIPKEACEGFHKSIREAADMYGDEERQEYYDADDTCQRVCWELEGYLGEE